VMDEPPVRFFTMGVNRWQTAEGWPPPGIAPVNFYFQEGPSGSAKSLNDGRLSPGLPTGERGFDGYAYDPADPVETHGGSIVDYSGKLWGPRDQRTVETRCLTYTSEPLAEDLEVTGQVTATLYAMSTAPDTDWVVRLTDVSPVGVSRSIVDGILRARCRDSQEHPTLLTPNQVYRFVVDLWSTSNVFLTGHRIRVAVTSSSFPRWDRNLNTGGPFGLEAVGQVAFNTVFRDQARPSHITLPTRRGMRPRSGNG
jgi:putative CocE/NonD family hydrolase